MRMPSIDPTDTIGGILIRHGGRAFAIQPNLEPSSVQEPRSHFGAQSQSRRACSWDAIARFVEASSRTAQIARVSISNFSGTFKMLIERSSICLYNNFIILIYLIIYTIVRPQ